MTLVTSLCGALARIALIPATLMLIVVASGADQKLVEGVTGLIQTFQVLG